MEEFMFRSKDVQPSTYASQSSSFTYFTEQAIRAGYSNNNFGRPHDFFRNPNYMREAIQRELVKEQIREELIAEEIARMKRELEAEVRREMVMEKEMALRRSDGFTSQGLNRLPILHQQEGKSFEGRIIMSLDERLGQPLRRDIGGFGMVPSHCRPGPEIAEIKPVLEVDKNKVITLGKPNTTINGVKRKAVTPPDAGTSDLTLAGSMKQPKEEWSCDICQVSVTSEQGLNVHFEGKRHKSKEAAIMAQKTGQNFGIGILPKKTPVPIKLVETISKPSSVQIIEKKKSHLLKNKHFKQQTNDLKTEGNGEVKESRKNEFKFWCEMCQVGALSEKGINIHRSGKKHARLLELKLNVGEAAPMAKEQSDVVAEEETKMTKDLINFTPEEATNVEETKSASEKVVGVDKEARLEESEEVAEC